MGIHLYSFVFLLIAVLGAILPIVLGFTFVRLDANRIGQPGWLWAFLTIPLGWIAILGYLVVRAITPTQV
jgi:hypothetical protein